MYIIFFFTNELKEKQIVHFLYYSCMSVLIFLTRAFLKAFMQDFFFFLIEAVLLFRIAVCGEAPQHSSQCEHVVKGAETLLYELLCKNRCFARSD